MSHTAHFVENETLFGWGPTVREIDRLATRFDEVVHVAPLHSGKPYSGALPYRAENVQLRAVPPSGGSALISKLNILRHYPTYFRAISREMREADVVHVRCPANISLLALAILMMARRPNKRWLKYAGNWQAYSNEPLSYKLQRWWLRSGLSRGHVTVNGQWENDPDHVHPFVNPCLSNEELEKGRRIAASKMLKGTLRLLYVGRLEREKGVARTLRILADLRQRGVDATLDLVGDGPQRSSLVSEAKGAGLSGAVVFHGWLTRGELNDFYETAHFVLLPSECSEGWPKVLSEGMAFGALPIASDVSSVPKYLNEFGVGRALPISSEKPFVDALEWYLATPEDWKREARRAADVAEAFTYERYLNNVAKMLALPADDEILV